MSTLDRMARRRELDRRHRAQMAVFNDLLAALAIAVFVLLVLDPGLGIVASIGLPVLLIGAVWLVGERLRRRLRRRQPVSPAR